jgi:uncharacterized protein YciI
LLVFIVLLKFSANKAQAPRLMQAHNDWIRRGFDQGVFLLTGSLQPNLGGSILAHKTSRAELESRLRADPFVAESVVTTEILEVAPSRASEPLQFLLG